MNFRLPPLGLLLVLTAVAARAQSTEPAAPPSTEPAAPPAPAVTTPATTPTPKGRLPEAKRSDRAGKYGKTVTPDPDLLDGSSYDKEKRPLHGMLSEIEIGEGEGGKSSKISPDSGPAGAAGAKPPEDQKQAAAPEGSAAAAGGAGGGSKSAVPQGPAGSAGGAQADSLKVPEGASGGGPNADGAKPQAQQIGDASLQIQTLPQSPENVVGAQGSNAQQFEKKVPAGGSSIPSAGNAGAEKGRVVPKGL